MIFNRRFIGKLLRGALLLTAFAFFLPPSAVFAEGEVDVKVMFGIGAQTRFNVWGMPSTPAGAPDQFLRALDYKLEIYLSDESGELGGIVGTKLGSKEAIKAGDNGLEDYGTFQLSPGLHFFKFYFKTTLMDEYRMVGSGGYFMVEPGKDSQEFFLAGLRVGSNLYEGRGFVFTVKDFMGNTLKPGYVQTTTSDGINFDSSKETYLVVATPKTDDKRYDYNIMVASIAGGRAATAEWSLEDTSAALYKGAKPYHEFNFTSELTASNVTIKVKKGLPIRLFTTKPMHYVPYLEGSFAQLPSADDDYDSWVYSYNNGDGGYGFWFETGGSGSGYLKQRQTVTLDRDHLTGPITISFDADESLDKTPKPYPEWSYFYDDMYFNMNDEQYKTLKVGEAFNLMPLRVWQAMEGEVGNFFIEPDYNVDTFGESAKSAFKGKPGQEYFELKATQPGVTVFRFTYDPVAIFNEPKDQYHDKGWTNPNYPDRDFRIVPSDLSLHFNVNDPKYTGVAVINVTDVDSGALKTGILQREYDTIYFDREKGFGTYEFTPSVEGSPNAEIGVRVHRPIHEGGGYENFSVDGGDPGWEDGTKNADGSFTVNLYDGRNIVEVKSGGMVKYHVVTAVGLKVNISNNTRPGEDFQVGDTARITFEGVRLAPAKLAAIYNPGFEMYGPGTNIIKYKNADDLSKEYKSPGCQYSINIPENTAIEVHIDKPGKTRLIEGANTCGHLGQGLGSHRFKVPTNEGANPMIDINAPSFTTSKPYGTMPDIEIMVAADPNAAAPVSHDIVSGVTVPKAGAPDSSLVDCDQYSGVVAWSPALTGNKFAAFTEYTATITLAPKDGYTLTGVSRDFFLVDGAASASNEEDSGVITALFPKTGAVQSGGPSNPGDPSTPVDGTSPIITEPPFTSIAPDVAAGDDTHTVTDAELAEVKDALAPDKATALDKATTTDEAGELVSNPGAVAEALPGDEKAEVDINAGDMIPLPVFKAGVESGKTVLVTIAVPLAKYADKNLSDVAVLKLKNDGKSEILSPASSPSGISHAEYVWTEEDGAQLPGGLKIRAGKLYYLSIAIKDNTTYDWDPAPGSVVDPIALTLLKTAGKPAENPSGGGNDSDGASGGSSGCDAGLGLAGLGLAVAIASARRGKRL